ncbi:hypothetical protein AB9F38_36095, partial [Rhizobium leguminosarum]
LIEHAGRKRDKFADTHADQEGRFLMIRGKGKKERLVPLSHSAISDLKSYGRLLAAENAVAKEPQESPWLFPSASKEGYL